MFAAKETKDQSKERAALGRYPASKTRAGGTSTSASLPGSTHFLQRHLGNSRLQSIAANRSFNANEDGDAMPAPSTISTPPTAPLSPTTPTPPTPPSTPIPPTAPSPVTTPLTVKSVEVDNDRSSITYRVPSIAGVAGRQHWVTVASLSGTPSRVKANLDPPVPATDPRASALQWTINGTGVASTGDPLHVEVRRNAGKKVVQATLGSSSAELTVWAVFARINSAGTADTIADTGAHLSVSTNVNFTARIIPSSLITDSDRPALHGANTVNPPGGANSCGNLLSGGVDHRWDMSRQMRLRNVDPAGHITTMGHCVDTVVGAYPADNALGNDDAGTGDENNDPYAGGGQITSSDTPRRFFSHALGANGDTIEQRLHFREFARLEYHRTWWKISYFFPWRFHIRIMRAGGRWVDNGTDSALDNTGF